MDIDDAQVHAELVALFSEETGILFVFKPAEVWTLMAQLQLALRHPKNTGPSAKVARGLVERLKQSVSSTPGLRMLADAGDDPQFDVQ